MNTAYKLAASLSLIACLSTANAALVTSAPSGTVIDFNGNATATNVIGAVQIGTGVGRNVTVASSSATNGLYFNFNGWGLLSNGTWGTPMTYVSLNGGTDSMIFAFNDGPVSSVGGFMNYAPGKGDLFVSALDASMGVLETYDVTSLADIVTPGGFNAGAFRGINTGSANISYFVVSGGLANALDNLTFSSSAVAQVPEPGSLALLGLGLAGLAAIRRRKQA